MYEKERLKIGNRISKVTIILNLLLSIVKIFAGIIGKSNAIILDGIHSISDVLSTVCVIIGLKLANKPEDSEHQYGHEKIEPIISKLLAFVLVITALMIGNKAVNIILAKNYTTPGKIAVYAAILSIVLKEWMYRYTIKGAKKINSAILITDAWHHRSDALSSLGTLVGIVGARMGVAVLEPIASIIICLIIIKVAVEIYIKAANQLMDRAADKGTIEVIKKDILGVKGVIKIDDLKTRIHASRLYVDVEIAVNKNLSVIQAHTIAEEVHYKVEDNIKKVKHCMVHVNPY
ncbi:cation diffusion facilitator family transporter [Clostridium aestuarii]|uniref:Cation diffusion facilitator family transporter n=1 Tax=Clostridium aestuarii TaxID=338193 RepID=A0ABT4D1U6_9CLOT|nr:cation diffusion facilitator family transporter [Clostridium aestuarii]MCY6485199.1 cation diffusion facilitator family transporter [Clostridium aestuarii]